MPGEFPRLLFATEYAPRSRGAGLVFVRQMLRGWPAERLGWWSCTAAAPSGEAQAVAQHFTAPLPGKLYPGRRQARLRAWLMETLWVPRATAHFRRTLREFKPDVVWVIPQQWAIPPLARALCGGTIPFRVTMHDYADLRDVVERIGPGTAARLARGAEQLYAAAAARDAICAPMLADLQARTGTVGWLNRVGLEAEDFAWLAAKMPRRLTELRLVFAGTIIATEAFEFLVRALAGIRARLPLPLRLELFGAHTHADKKWFDPAWMREQRNVPEAEFRAALRECAWGLAPVSLTDDDPQYHRFSFPAKISSYLAAGLPVIVLGHPRSSLVELAQRHRLGVCSIQTDLTTLQTELLAALTADDPWARFGADIERCVREEFDGPAMRERLHAELFRAAGR